MSKHLTPFAGLSDQKILQHYMDSRSMTLYELAGIIGLSSQTLITFMDTKRSPRPKTMMRIQQFIETILDSDQQMVIK